MFDRLPFFLVLQVWRGNVWHAGAGYSKSNTRLHFYIDSPLLKRKDNQVYNFVPKATRQSARNQERPAKKKKPTN